LNWGVGADKSTEDYTIRVTISIMTTLTTPFNLLANRLERAMLPKSSDGENVTVYVEKLTKTDDGGFVLSGENIAATSPELTIEWIGTPYEDDVNIYSEAVEGVNINIV